MGLSNLKHGKIYEIMLICQTTKLEADIDDNMRIINLENRYGIFLQEVLSIDIKLTQELAFITENKVVA